MLLRPGFEDWLINNDFGLIGSHWKHKTSLSVHDGNQKLSVPFPPVYGCNLGFSFRKAAKMRQISNLFSRFDLRQVGDSNCPEDAFYSFLGYGSHICKLPTLNECDIWAQDPLTRESWENKTYGFGFHYFREKSEFPPCNHS